ncbi:hypothetical protein IWW47_005356 [Coemansia sp. RSA 2052]|nr:hypothetical protein IWW47_005356 [Coemansia sp. RSA 2052]
MATATKAVPEKAVEAAPLDDEELSDESPELSKSEPESDISLTEPVLVDAGEDELLVLKACEESLVALLPLRLLLLPLLLLALLLVGLAVREEIPVVISEGSVMLGSIGCEGEGAVVSRPSRPAGIDAGWGADAGGSGSGCGIGLFGSIGAGA